MKIVFYRYNSICEPDFIEAFKQTGLEVSEITEEMYRKEIPAEERVRILLERITPDAPLFVFSIDYFPFISIVCERLGINYVSVIVDCPVAEIYSPTIRNSCNRVFFFDYLQFESVRDENKGNLHYLPLGAAVSRMDTLPYPGEYKYDISFIGSLYNEKDRYAALKESGAIEKNALAHLEEIIDKQKNVPGMDIIEEELLRSDIDALKNADPEFYTDTEAVTDMDRYVAINNYIGNHLTSMDRIRILNSLAEEFPGGRVHLFTRSDTSQISKNVVVHGGVNTLTEMPQVFRSSLINLNLTSRTIRAGIPQRVWDILGAGAFCLTDYTDLLEGVIDPYECVGVFKNAEEIPQMCRNYLDTPEVRENVMIRGYEMTAGCNTVLDRALHIVKYILSEKMPG